MSSLSASSSKSGSFVWGKSAGNYFYAMEFVEGETLEHLIKRSGRLDVKLALEIATQVAAGAAEICTKRQRLVCQTAILSR
jgi:serine/threonine protein kinase